MSIEKPTVFEISTHKGRMIVDKDELKLSYCGSINLKGHIKQLNDPNSWVHNVKEDWLRAYHLFEQARDYLKQLGYNFDNDGCYNWGFPHVRLVRWKNKGDTCIEMAIDGDVTVLELQALAIILEAKNDGKI